MGLQFLFMSRGEPPEEPTGVRQLALLDELRRAERRAVSSRVASVVAHLIGTPLHVIAGRASLIRSASTDPSVSENARRVEEQVEKLAQRIRRLIDYLTVPEPTQSVDSAKVVVTTALALYAPIARLRGVTLELGAGAAPDVKLDATSALVLLTGLLSLAIQIVPPGSVCELRAHADDDGQVSFELDVPGLLAPQGRLDSLEPLEGPSQAGTDTWQVLSVCGAIARRGGGSLDVTPREAGGATLRYRVRHRG